MNTRSIDVRLTVWYTTLVVAVAAAFAAYTYLGFERGLYAEMQTMLARRLAHLQEDIGADLSPSAPADMLARQIGDIYSPEKNDRFIRISRNGAILYVSGAPRDQSFVPADIPLPDDYAAAASEPLPNLRSVRRLMLVGLRTPSGYVLEMGAGTAPVENALHRLVFTLLAGLPLVVAVAAMGGSFLVRRALRPVEAMRMTAEEVTFGKLQKRLPVTGADDAIDHLARTLNRMLDRLDQAYQQASRFSADASHELRTPLAVMRGEIESILHDPSVPGGIRDRAGSVLEESERLSLIVDRLFSLARLDAGDSMSKAEIFDLAELVRATIEQMALLAEVKNLSVRLSADMPVPVRGDPVRLRQVVVNLFDNATKYTLAGGSIAIAVVGDRTRAVLTVADNGIGIPPAVLPHVFERFYRADNLRGDAAGGAGLGLAIVQSICRAHGGDVRARSEDGAGTEITVELPLAGADGEEV